MCLHTSSVAPIKYTILLRLYIPYIRSYVPIYEYVFDLAYKDMPLYTNNFLFWLRSCKQNSLIRTPYKDTFRIRKKTLHCIRSFKGNICRGPGIPIYGYTGNTSAVINYRHTGQVYTGEKRNPGYKDMSLISDIRTCPYIRINCLFLKVQMRSNVRLTADIRYI